MRTAAQKLGDWGEVEVTKRVLCRVCFERKLTQLQQNFPSLDLVCRNCGAYMAQVKTHKLSPGAPDKRPGVIRAAGWKPLQVQVSVGVLRDMYIVGALPDGNSWKAAWIDRVPGPALLANLQVFEPHVASIHGGARLHPMYNIRYSALPKASIIQVYPQ